MITEPGDVEDSEIVYRCFFRDTETEADAAVGLVSDFNKRVKIEAGISLLRQRHYIEPARAAKHIAERRKNNNKAIGVLQAKWKDVKRIAMLFTKVDGGHISARTAVECSAQGEHLNDRTCNAAHGKCYFDYAGNADELTKLLGQFELALPAKFYSTKMIVEE